MKKSYIIKVITLISTVMLMTAALSACKMNLPDTHGIGPDGSKSSEEDSDEDIKELEDMFLDDADGNTDVTAGTAEDGTYSMAAALNDGATYFYVDAVEAVLKNKDASKAASAKDKAGDLNKARLAYLTEYYEGDETSAKEDLAEMEKATADGAQMDAIKSFYPEIGKVFAQFDIANYDFTAPTDADESSVMYDVYSSDNQPFSMEFSFEDGVLTDINFAYDGEMQ